MSLTQRPHVKDAFTVWGSGGCWVLMKDEIISVRCLSQGYNNSNCLISARQQREFNFWVRRLISSQPVQRCYCTSRLLLQLCLLRTTVNHSNLQSWIMIASCESAALDELLQGKYHRNNFTPEECIYQNPSSELGWCLWYWNVASLLPLNSDSLSLYHL